jgi:plasmid maintenance system antidote protein VapI
VRFRDVLTGDLDARRARNPRYSLRAYARALKLDHATLSQLLRGKRRLTTRMVRRVGAQLKLTAVEIDLHCAQENDAAVLRLIQRATFRPDSRWIAAQLGIPLDEVNVTIQRLIRLRSIALTTPRTWEVLRG